MLNTEAFVVLAGNSAPWDGEIRARCAPGIHEGTFESEGLCKVQEDQWARGRRGARLHRTMYGWSVRHDSGLENWGILYSQRHLPESERTLAAAVAFGTAWVNEDPEHREFYAYRKDVEGLLPTAGL
jgi:hypothetical protein